MIKPLLFSVLLVVLSNTFCFSQTSTTDKPMSLHSFTVNTLEGQPQSLSAFKDKVILVVNVASKCGATKQYKGLEALYQQYKDKGFVILGFPSNEFGGQEPGTPQEIRQFCSTTYQVSFPLFEKVKTNNTDASPVYQFLTAHHPAPKWNFYKYLLNQKGEVIAAFPKEITPESPELRSAIDAALAKIN